MEGADFDFEFACSRLPSSFKPKLELILLPCGKCDSCRLSKSAEWTARNLMESEYHEHGCFLTLTVNDKNMPDVFPNGSLCHKPFQDFMKRLRQKVYPLELTYMMCGEYGDQRLRPHYHCLLYGYDFPDAVFWDVDDSGYPLYRSPELEELWTFGFSYIGGLDIGSIQYVCRYVLKKALSSKEYGDLKPEYICMSRNPAIGKRWFDDHGLTSIYNCGEDLIFPNDYIYCGDFKQRPPRYYDKLLEKSRNADYVSLKNQRKRLAPSLMSLRKCDLVAAEEYLKCVFQGRIKRGNHNV